MSSVIRLEEESELPSGIPFVDETGVWTIQINSQKLIHTSKERKEIDISELQLSERDQILRVKYLQRDNVIFVYAKRENVPTGFFISLKSDKKSYVPGVLSFSAETLLFHANIYDCLAPVESAICIISQEGMTLHRQDLRPTFSLMAPITAYCHNKNYVMIYSTENKSVTIYRFSEALQTTVIFSQEYWKAPIPNAMIALSTCVLLISCYTGALVTFHVISLTGKQQMMTYQRSFDLDDPMFFSYDDLLYIQSRTTNNVCLVDVFDSHGLQLGEVFPGVPGIIGITEDYVVTPGRRYAMKQNYEEIVKHNPKIIASLFRRKNGPVAAMKFLHSELSSINNGADMVQMMTVIAPYVTACDVQMRVVNALQFGTVKDPHMILIGMMTLLRTLGEDATGSTKASMLRAMTHPLCVHSISNLLMVNDLTLDLSLLRILIGGAGLSVNLSEKNMDDPLDYVQVCIEYGFKDAARRMLLKQALNGSTDKERIRCLKEQL